MIGVAEAINKARPRPGELILHAYPATSYGGPTFFYGVRLDEDQIKQEQGYSKVFEELTGSPGKWARFREAVHAWHLIAGKSQDAFEKISRPIVCFIRNPGTGGKIIPNDWTYPNRVTVPEAFEPDAPERPGPGDHIRYTRAEAPDKNGVLRSFAYPGYWIIDYCKFLDRFPDWVKASDDPDPNSEREQERRRNDTRRREYRGKPRRVW